MFMILTCLSKTELQILINKKGVYLKYFYIFQRTNYVGVLQWDCVFNFQALSIKFEYFIN